MSEYINTPTTDAGASASGIDALDGSQSGRDTPVREGGTAVPFPNADSALSEEHICGAPDCLKVFFTRAELRKHAKSTGHKIYRCECGFADNDKSNVDWHIVGAKRAAARSIIHVQATFENAHTCAVEGCRQVFSNDSKLQEHAKKAGHKAYQCVCRKGYSKLCSLSRHIDESRTGGAGKYRCPLKSAWPGESSEDCWHSFQRFSHLKQHLRGGSSGLYVGHRKTAQEAEIILEPLRKRKPAVPKHTLTTDVAATVSAAHDGPLNAPTGNSTALSDPTSDYVAGRKAFLAVTMGLIPSTQGANNMMPTAGPVQDEAGSQARPLDFTAEPLIPGGFLPMTDASSFGTPAWSGNHGLHAPPALGLANLPVNGYASPQSVYGNPPPSFSNVQSNEYAMPTPNGLAMSSLVASPAAWATPFLGNESDGFGLHHNTSMMTPGHGTFLNQTEGWDAYSPMYPPPSQHATFNNVGMGCYSQDAGQLTMRPPGQRGAFEGTFDPSMFGPTGFDSGADMRTQNVFMGQSLYGSQAAAPQAEVPANLTDYNLLDSFDFPDQMSTGDYGMGYNGSEMDFGGPTF